MCCEIIGLALAGQKDAAQRAAPLRCHDTQAYKHWGMCRKEEGVRPDSVEEKLTYKTQTL